MSPRKYFQYISDLHIDKRQVNKIINPIAPYLIVAGDVCPLVYTDLNKNFFEQHSKKFNSIFYVYGNHEYDQFHKFQKSINYPKNIIHLENQIYTIDNILLLGSTLWTQSTNKQKNNLAIEYINYICNNSIYKNYKIIIITHHLPSYHLIIKKYRGYKNLDRFANSLEYIMNPKHTLNPPRFWISGHSHCIFTNKIYNTICHINTYSIGKKFAI